jgi:hypothetical protein
MKNDPRETPSQKQARLRGKLSNPALRGGENMISTPGSGISLRDRVSLSVNSSGECVLACSATVCGDDDFVGVFVNASQPEGDSLGWEWCTHTSSFPYNTGVAAQAGYVAIYWSKDFVSGNYVAVAITDALPANPTSGTTVTGTST